MSKSKPWLIIGVAIALASANGSLVQAESDHVKIHEGVGTDIFRDDFCWEDVNVGKSFGEIQTAEKLQNTLHSIPRATTVDYVKTTDSFRQSDTVEARIYYPNVDRTYIYRRVPCPRPGTSSVQTYVGLEVGGGGAKASYDELIIDPKSFVGGAFMGVRIPQPNDWFFGAQAGFFGTDLTREAARGFTVGLEWGMPLDVQVGKTIQTAWGPTTFYAYAGTIFGRTRATSAGVTDHFTLFGVTAGAGADVKITQHWALGGKVRWFSLDPSDAKSAGQHVDGVIGTVSLLYLF